SSTASHNANPDQPVQFSATVATSPPDPYHPGSDHLSIYGVPTGMVQFSDNGVDFGPSEPLDSTGTAESMVAQHLDPGPHAITGRYLGDSGQIFGAARSSLMQYVQMSPTVSTLTVTQDHIPYGSSLQFRSQVTGDANDSCQ